MSEKVEKNLTESRLELDEDDLSVVSGGKHKACVPIYSEDGKKKREFRWIGVRSTDFEDGGVRREWMKIQKEIDRQYGYKREERWYQTVDISSIKR